MELPAALIDTQTSARNWDLGCVHDKVRNEFIIPTLSGLLNDYKPSRILDVGAGTGFVSRSVDNNLAYRPSWTLIDFDQDRLNISIESAPLTMRVEHYAHDILSSSWDKQELVFDAAIVCFTIVEVPRYNELLATISSCMSVGGTIILVTPDPWQEVMANRDLTSKLLDQRISIEKTDKFTGMPYPYYISRNEAIIADVLALGFSMNAIIKPENGHPVFLMVFRKLMFMGSE